MTLDPVGVPRNDPNGVVHLSDHSPASIAGGESLNVALIIGNHVVSGANQPRSNEVLVCWIYL